MDYSFLSKVPLFTSKDLKTYLNLKGTSVYLDRWLKNNSIIKIEKGKYTLHDDPFIYATSIVTPSYISFFSALSYYGYTTQIPLKVSVATSVVKKSLENIEFIKISRKHLFGYKRVNYRGFDICIATKEKLLLDCLLYQNSGVSVYELEELIKSNLDINRLVVYLKRINSISLYKRCGFILDFFGIDLYNEFEKKIKDDKNYILLNSNIEYIGEISKKWRVYNNEVFE